MIHWLISASVKSLYQCSIISFQNPYFELLLFFLMNLSFSNQSLNHMCFDILLNKNVFPSNCPARNLSLSNLGKRNKLIAHKDLVACYYLFTKRQCWVIYIQIWATRERTQDRAYILMINKYITSHYLLLRNGFLILNVHSGAFIFIQLKKRRPESDISYNSINLTYVWSVSTHFPIYSVLISLRARKSQIRTGRFWGQGIIM